MTLRKTLAWALLTAAPIFSQPPVWSDPRVSKRDIRWFRLTENPLDVRNLLGQPSMVAEFGDYRSWQYKLGEGDHDDFSHTLVFRKSDGRLVSISRNYNPERNVDALFPAKSTSVSWRPVTGQPDFPMMVRRLSNGRVLIGVGISKPGQPTGQIVLIREDELSHFYPWLAVP